jgi:hypothetical protein
VVFLSQYTRDPSEEIAAIFGDQDEVVLYKQELRFDENSSTIVEDLGKNPEVLHNEQVES